MIHIKKNKQKKFYVVVTGKNSEILSTSEILNSKQAAWKNIVAMCKEFELYSEFETVKDEAAKKVKKKLD